MRRRALDPKHWENIKDVSKWGSCPPAAVEGEQRREVSPVLSKVDGGQSESKLQRQADRPELRSCVSTSNLWDDREDKAPSSLGGKSSCIFVTGQVLYVNNHTIWLWKKL